MIRKQHSIAEGLYTAPSCTSVVVTLGTVIAASTNGSTIDDLTYDEWDEVL